MTTKGEKAAEFINSYIWVFHTFWFGYSTIKGVELL